MLRRSTVPAALALCALVCLALGSCSSRRAEERVVYTNPLDSLGMILTRTGVAADPAISSDGHGSIRIEASGPTTIRLAEVQPQDAENATLIYRARLKAQNVAGQAYLEMWCDIPGKGEFFSRGLQSPLSGTVDWVTQQTPFFLQKGQRAQTVKLNVVIAGTGVVWIDDLSLAVAAQ